MSVKWLFDSLAVRIALLFLAGLVALQVTIISVVLWPDDRPMMFRLIEPDDALAIARALESAPSTQQALVVEALNGRGTRIELLEHRLDEYPGAARYRPAPRLEKRFQRFAAALEGRAVRVEVRGGIFAADQPVQFGRGPVRLFVELRTGQTLVLERVPLVWQKLASRYVTITLVAALLVLGVIWLCVWYIVRPLSRLTGATRAFADDMATPDLAVTGPAEIRALALAFNAMKHTISTLVAERTRVLAAVAHDLRTYLTRMRLRAPFIEDLHQRGRATADIEEMAQLLDDVLLLAQVNEQEQPAIPVIDAAREILAYVALRQEMEDPVNKGTIELEARCRCAPLAFRRVLSNLTDNALRYGKSATISLISDGEVVLSVTDQGPGVPEELITRLTDPFERLEPSRGRSTGGAGLGLAIVKALADQNRASLVIENNPTGGLKVEVRFPRP